MAKIVGESSKNDYGFYAILTQSKPDNYLEINSSYLYYYIYLVNNGKRTESSNWAFIASIDDVEVYNKTKQKVASNSVDFYEPYLVFSGKELIEHNNDGTKVIKFSAKISKSSYSSYDPGECKVEGEFTFESINRLATVLTASDFTDEENPSLSFSNPAGFNVYPYLNFYDDDNNLVYQLLRNSKSVESPYNWEITAEERKKLWLATNKQSQYKVSVGVETYNETTKLGYNSKSQIMSYEQAEPAQTITFTELNQKVIDLLGSDAADIIIQNISQLKVVSIPTAKKEALISKIQFEHNNISTADSEEPYEHTITPVNSIFKVTVNDGRGYSIPETFTKDIVEYFPVNIISIDLDRVSSTSADLNLNCIIQYKQAKFNTTDNVPSLAWKVGVDGVLNILSETDYTIDIENNLLIISNLVLKDVIAWDETSTFFLYINDLLTDDTDSVPIIKGVPTFSAGRTRFTVNGTLFIADEDGNNRQPVLKYIVLEEWEDETSVEETVEENT